MHKTSHWLQWAIVGCLGVYLAARLVIAAHGDSANDFHYRDFATLLVQENGRIKPLSTVAITRLMLITHKQSVKEPAESEKDARTVSADKWLLDVMSLTLTHGRNKPALEEKIFRIENLELLGFLHLELRPGNWRYSYMELGPQYAKLIEEVKRARETEQDRTLFQTKVLELWTHITLFSSLAQLQTPGVYPVDDDNWLSVADVESRAGKMGQKLPPPVAAFLGILQYYADGDVAKFNESVKQYQDVFDKKMPEATEKARSEVYFNELAPFYQCAALYVFVFVLACVSWVGGFHTFNRAAFWSMLLVVLLHTWALFMRMYLQDRWLVFVTNLYSSAIFIGWGCVVTCLISEFFFRNSIALAVGAATGASSLVIAHFISLDAGDTMEMMRAVLDTNFWLATHVTCVTLGYTATFVAGFMGITYVAAMATTAGLHWFGRWHVGVREFLETPASTLGARGFFTRFFDTNASAEMSRMIYGIVCFGMLLSFTGTVLGGLWADYSWGRFWGWDPKENGALLIVIWCALILHARWGGLVKHRGLAILAVLGNIVTSWSWFGTNFLGVGLHAYASAPGAMWWLVGFDTTILTIVAIGLLPLARWARLPPPSPVL